MAIAANDRDVSLCQQIADIHQSFHLSGQEAAAGKRLAYKQIEERISFAGGDVVGVYRGQTVAATVPLVGGNPTGLAHRDVAGKLGGDRSLARGAEGQLGRRTPQHKQRRRAQGERVAIGNVKSAGQSRRKFVLGDGAYPMGDKVAAVVGETLRKGISEHGPRGIIGGVIAQAQQGSVAQAIGEAS